VLLEEGRPEDALTHLEHAVDVDPVSDDGWRVLGNAQADLGRGDDAIESYRHALALNESDTWAMNNLGLLLIRQGRYEEALPALARASELKPASAVFQNNLGVALERSGHTAAAAEAYRAAVAADSTYDKAVVSLARVEPLAGDAVADPTDLVAMARAFVEEIVRWSDAVVATSREPGS
jgi:Tfp pilus assembly protein PilF